MGLSGELEIVSSFWYKCSKSSILTAMIQSPDSKVHGANMGSIWGRQDLVPIIGTLFQQISYSRR